MKSKYHAYIVRNIHNSTTITIAKSTKMKAMKDVVIVGAGIAGVATAVALKRVGIRPLILEKADCLRTTGTALSLFPNAWLALEALGVAHKIPSSLYATPLRGSVTNVATGAVQPIAFAENRGPKTIYRKGLLETLARELPVDSIQFSTSITSIELQEQGSASIPILHLEDGTTIRSKVLIGSDGVHSMVAKWMGLAEPIHSGRWAVRGLAVYPQGHGFHKDEVQQFVDVGKRGGFVPLTEKEIYWFLDCPPEGNETPESPEMTQKYIIEKYAKDFPSTYLDIVRRADLAQLSWAPLMLRNPWNVLYGNTRKGNVTAAGDAMHPMTPDLAQGGGTALEDAVVLGRLIGNSFIENGSLVPEKMAGVLDAYVKERRWRTAGLITGAYLSGWIQEKGSNPLLKFLRDGIFYRYLFSRLSKAVFYDCGKLPTVPANKLHSTDNTA